MAGLLLVVFSPARAEDAFWTLVALVEDRLPASCVLKVRTPVVHGVTWLRRLTQGLFCHQWRLFRPQAFVSPTGLAFTRRAVLRLFEIVCCHWRLATGMRLSGSTASSASQLRA